MQKVLALKSVRWTLLGLTLLNQVFLGLVYTDLPGGSQTIFGLQFSFTLSRFLHIVTYWQEQGVQLFLTWMWSDYTYPLFYGLFIESLLITKNITLPRFFRPGIIAALFDMIENSLHIYILSTHTYFAPLIFLASLAAVLKWFFILHAIFRVLSPNKN